MDWKCVDCYKLAKENARYFRKLLEGRGLRLRTFGFILTLIGFLVCLATAALWIWLNAFACGMSPNGCNSFSLHWEDTEALAYFIPPFVLGCLLTVAGVFTIINNRKV